MLQELLLIHHCIRCGKCVDACPADAIFPLDASWGAATGTPAIDPRQQPCVLCDGLKCSHACPSDALLPTYVNRDVAMGTAVIDEARCLTWHGQGCDACQKVCPMQGALTLSDQRMRVDPALCVGCGLCVRACPTEPSSINVRPRD
jgi:ferredoxin-type protein NapG